MMAHAHLQPDGARIVELRSERGWTQEQLAERARISARKVSDLERNVNTTRKTLDRVAGTFGIPTDNLIAARGPKSSKDSLQAKKPLGRIGVSPPPPRLLIGRSRELLEIKRRIVHAAELRSPKSQAVTVVRGWPGVGKTSLMCGIAHDPEVTAAFRDGILWVSLGQAPNLAAELATWGRAAGCEEFSQALTLRQAQAILAARLRERSVLLIVDDVWEAEHATLFCVGGQGCATLVTTRDRHLAESVAPSAGDVYKLDVLSEEAGLEVLSALAPNVVNDHRAECRSLVRELEGLPLALQVAGRLLKAEAGRGWDVKDLVRELRDDAAPLLDAAAPADMADVDSRNIPTVTALFRKSTDRLDEATRERFAYLAAFAPKPATFLADDAAAVWDVDAEEAKRTLDTLIDRGLVEPLGDSQFCIHALLKVHAKSLCTE